MTQEWPAPAVAVAGIVWTTNSDDGTVSHIDATTGRRHGGPVRVGREPKGVTEGFGSVWVAKGRDDTVTRLGPRTGRRIGRPIRVGDQPGKPTAGAGLVWVTSFGAGMVSRIDPRTGRVVGGPAGRAPPGGHRIRREPRLGGQPVGRDRDEDQALRRSTGRT